MTFPSSENDDLATAWASVRSVAGGIKRSAQHLHDRSAAGDINADIVVSFASLLADHNDTLSRYASVPGLSAYAQQQTGNAVDIVAEYQALLAEINATRNWILANFPKDGSGYLLYHTFSGTGRIVVRTLTPVQTAGLRTQLLALIARID